MIGFVLSDMEQSYTFAPIGVVHCSNRYKFEAPRQGVYSHGSRAEIELLPGCDFETALCDLDGFARIWVIFVFDRNHGWKPKVSPPAVAGKKRIGVFATRSPHRPNPVGMSCVELEKIEGRRLFIRNHDFLDGTPVLDLKPYIPAADCFPGSKAGWRDEADASEVPVNFEPAAETKMAYIEQISGLDLENFCRVQLAHHPESSERKRVERLPDGRYSIGCRTWRVVYELGTDGVRVLDVVSHYRVDELAAGAPDQYGDKDCHRSFAERFKDET